MFNRLTICLSFFVLAVSGTALADNAIQVTSISGASNHSDLNASGTVTVYGGIVGPIANCDTSDDGTLCNNCTITAPAEPCNRRRIHPNLYLTINFKVTGDLEGEVYLGYSNGGTAEAFDEANYEKPSGTFRKDSTGTVKIKWTYLCELTTGDTACENLPVANDSAILYLSVGDGDLDAADRISINVKTIHPESSNALGPLDFWCDDTSSPSPDAGICEFEAKPGDEKVYIINLGINRCPTLGSATVKYARVYYSTGDFTTIGYHSSYADLEVDDDCNPVGDWVIEGLQNNTLYFFRVAVVDEAYNSVFINRYTGVPGSDVTSNYAACDVGGAFDDLTCPMSATPENVLGLLPEDVHCFIATAAFGSAFEKHVKTLREFRNRFLLTNSLGRTFVRFYYRVSPALADWIRERPAARSVARILLWPAWAFSAVALQIGALPTVLALIFMIASGFWAVHRSNERRRL